MPSFAPPMPTPPMHIDTEFADRILTLRYDRILNIEHAATGDLLGAYLTPLGARQLIDALEPLAAPRAGWAVLSGIEYLAGADPRHAG